MKAENLALRHHLRKPQRLLRVTCSVGADSHVGYQRLRHQVRPLGLLAWVLVLTGVRARAVGIALEDRGAMRLGSLFVNVC